VVEPHLDDDQRGRDLGDEGRTPPDDAVQGDDGPHDTAGSRHELGDGPHDAPDGTSDGTPDDAAGGPVGDEHVDGGGHHHVSERARYRAGTFIIAAAVVVLVAVLVWLQVDSTRPASSPGGGTSTTVGGYVGPQSERIGGTTTVAPTSAVPTSEAPVAPSTTAEVPTTVPATTVPATTSSTAPLPALGVNLTVPACVTPGATVEVVAVSSIDTAAAGLRWDGATTGVSQMSGGPRRWIGGVTAGSEAGVLSVRATVRDAWGRQASVTQQLRAVDGCEAPPVS